MANGIYEEPRGGGINKNRNANGNVLLTTRGGTHLDGARNLIDRNTHKLPPKNYAALER